ncbi:hypothetical protein D9757_000239 [Collybiopsis confluens]|uniref:Uncharacterized protein n=1 Tax=Collybiopsis confluens TaxID=2823264 RepID=A0A8H5I217_9AGAR|nr:hypothetical protein D9757_000239 [Collybiopsis confluens]
MNHDPALSTKQQIFAAVQSNTQHQYALEKYSQRLAAELQEIDKLLAAADINVDSDEELEDIEVKEASRPTGLIPESELLSPYSPFYNDAIKRSRYLNFALPHPMKPKELETLTDAVAAEFRRLRALENLQSGINSAEPIDLAGNVEKLNWKTVAEKVSDVSSYTRTDRECKMKWLGYQRPGINHDQWKPAELERLKKIIEEKEQDKEYKLDWAKIAAELGTHRTPIDCMRHGFQHPRHVWTSEADKKLVEGVRVYGSENWALVSRHVSLNVSPHQCHMRFMRSLDPQVNKSPWTTDEDDRLNKIISAIGTSNWVDVARHISGRTNEMCRERYLEVGPNRIKGKKKKGKAREADDDWSKEEEAKLMHLVGEMGTRWLKISEEMGGMYSNNQCRSKYNKLKKQSDSVLDGSTVSMPSTHPSHPQQVNSNLSSLILAPHLVSSSSNIGPPTSSSSVASNQTVKPRPKPKSKPQTSTSASTEADTVNLHPLTQSTHESEENPEASNSEHVNAIASSVRNATTTQKHMSLRPDDLQQSNEASPATALPSEGLQVADKMAMAKFAVASSAGPVEDTLSQPSSTNQPLRRSARHSKIVVAGETDAPAAVDPLPESLETGENGIAVSDTDHGLGSMLAPPVRSPAQKRGRARKNITEGVRRSSRLTKK